MLSLHLCAPLHGHEPEGNEKKKQEMSKYIWTEHLDSLSLPLIYSSTLLLHYHICFFLTWSSLPVSFHPPARPQRPLRVVSCSKVMESGTADP